ncbi:hypothetical protein [Streptomyces sp. NPDC048436]|uniref:hypothetical protein n=1 Tax=Streptomyces sp. NPDC048436 TaxID=3365550 RepID=UPI003718BEF3
MGFHAFDVQAGQLGVTVDVLAQAASGPVRQVEEVHLFGAVGFRYCHEYGTAGHGE